MAFVEYNPNPSGSRTGDCVVRAISKATNKTWEKVYVDLAIQGFMMHDMPTSNIVWESYLKEHNFRKYLIPDKCPDCYTVREFCEDNYNGVYILATGNHAVACIDGNYYDSWNSGDEIISYYLERDSD